MYWSWKIMSHYTLAWHDSQDTEQYICEYASDAFEAVRNAREDVPYLHEHPFSLDKIKKEEWWKIYQSDQRQSFLDLFVLHYLHILTTLGYEKN